MKIDDGFQEASSSRVARPAKTYGAGMMLTFGAVVLLAAVLGFLGGMQVNKSTTAQSGSGPSGMSSTSSGSMPTPPSSSSSTNSSTSTNSTSSTSN